MMKRIFLGLFLLVGITLLADEKNFIDQNYIEVNGQAEMEIVPNEIYVRITLNEKNFKGKALEAIEKNMFQVLKSAGIDVAKDLKLNDASSNFGRVMLKKEALVEKEYVLLVRTGKLLIKVYRGLDAVGISDMNVIGTDHSDLETYKRKVRVNAVKAAKEKAYALAQALGQSVGRALYLNENGGFYRPNAKSKMEFSVSGILADNSFQEPEIEFESIKLQSEVTVRFELK